MTACTSEEKKVLVRFCEKSVKRLPADVTHKHKAALKIYNGKTSAHGGVNTTTPGRAACSQAGCDWRAKIQRTSKGGELKIYVRSKHNASLPVRKAKAKRAKTPPSRGTKGRLSFPGNRGLHEFVVDLQRQRFANGKKGGVTISFYEVLRSIKKVSVLVDLSLVLYLRNPPFTITPTLLASLLSNLK